MELTPPSQTIARAKFRFEGSNNDELPFEKNDVIVLTQQPEGGWWEGTLNGQTGWFPSGYVTIITEREKLMRSRSVPNASAKAHEHLSPVDLSNREDYRMEVLKNFIKNERQYVESLQTTIANCFVPIKNSNILSQSDYEILCGNFKEILAVQINILDEVDANAKEAPEKQRVGGILLKSAVNLRAALLKYSENHPRAVEVIKEKNKPLEDVLKSSGRQMNDLISGMSEPFRHIDRYHSVMQELERIVLEGHADRGDLHRSGVVFKEIKECCEVSRKQKEAQLEFLYVAKLEKIVPFSDRGSILFVGNGTAKIGKNVPDDKFVALFSKYLMFFDITSTMAYQLHEKFSTQGMTITKTDANEFTIENATTSLEILFTLATSPETDRWITAFSRAENVFIAAPVNLLRKNSSNQNNYEPVGRSSWNVEPPPIRNVQRLTDENLNGTGLRFDHNLEMILPEGCSPTTDRSARPLIERNSFDMMPPSCKATALREPVTTRKGPKMRKEVAREEEDDFAVLRIIEGYCIESSGAAEHGGGDHAPQLIVAEDERILVEEVIGDEVVLQEKSIVDAVYTIKDQLALLQNEFQKLTKVVEGEQKARRRLEHFLPKNASALSTTDQGPL